MKRILCTTLFVLLCLALLSAGALAAEEAPAQDGGPALWEIRTETYIVDEKGMYSKGGGTLTTSFSLAEPGEYVNYTVLADEGYRLLSVKTNNGSITYEDITDGAGFYMPNETIYVTALFEKVPGYNFVVDVDPAGAGMVKLVGRQVNYTMLIDLANVPAGRQTLEALPLDNHVFDHWADKYGSCISGENPYVFDTMGDVHLKAVFTEVADYYSVTDGADGIWTRGVDGNYQMSVIRSFQSGEAYLLFKEAEMDGVLLKLGTDYDYAPDDGCTAMTFYKSFLEKLEPGVHNVILRFATGEASTTLTVANSAAKPTVVIGGDGIAHITGSFYGLYARAAIVIDNNGSSGLIIAQATINPDGSIVIPVFKVPGLTVKGVNLSLVPTVGDIPSTTPNVVATATQFYT